MPFAGLSTTTRPAEDCEKSYKFVQTYQLPFGIQNAWKQPTAKSYVEQLISEAPSVKNDLGGKLAVVTGVTIGGAGYHAAEELALQVGMHVVLLGRTEAKLQAAIDSIKAEANKRKIDIEPTLFRAKYDLDDLASAETAAEYDTKLVKDKYDGKLHVLLNNAGVVSAQPRLTKDGIEANVGRNFITVHYLTELLLPVLKAAATSGHKPRIVDVASISHIFGADFDPARFVDHPKQGGAPPGHVEESNDGTSISFPKDPLMEGAKNMYGRAKMAVVAANLHMQLKHPDLNFVCLHPGSIASNFGADMGVAAKIYYYGFYLFQYTASQGAVAELRPCLDPDFNTAPDLQGAYLHCDGNPWVPYGPIGTINPDTGEPYTMEEFGKATVEAADKLIEEKMKA